MKITRREVLNSRGALKILMGYKIPVSVSYRLAKIGIAVEAEAKAITTTTDKMVTDYGVENDKGVKELKTDNEHYKELDELLDGEVNLDVEPVTLPAKVASTCDKCNHNMDKPFEIEPIVLMFLDKFITVG